MEKIMISSYGETSGFSTVSSEELTSVNGGLGACQMYTNTPAMNGCTGSGGGGGGGTK
jgi:hypothetical protein